MPWTNRNWASWVPDPGVAAYGYTYSVYLGLAMPAMAMKNADNYVTLALCLLYAALDCLGKFQNDIVYKRDVALHASSRTAQRIRSREIDLEKDDIPTVTSENFASLDRTGARGAGLKNRYLIGQTKKHPGSFKDF